MTDMVDNFINDVLYYKRLDKKLGLKIDFSEYTMDNFEQVIQIDKLESMTTKEVDEFIINYGYDIELVYKWELNGTENFDKIVRSDVTFLVFVFIPFVVLFYFVIYGDDRKKKTIYKN